MTQRTKDHGHPRLLSLTSLAFLLAACTNHDRERADAAVAVLEEFQTALRNGARNRCRSLMTAASMPALDQIRWSRMREQKPLQILAARPERGEVLVRVRDPNEQDRESDFVVVRENGRYVVDLVATAGLHTAVSGEAVTTGDLEPRELTPADHDRIRQQQLAAPPK